MHHLSQPSTANLFSYLLYIYRLCLNCITVGAGGGGGGGHRKTLVLSM